MGCLFLKNKQLAFLKDKLLLFSSNEFHLQKSLVRKFFRKMISLKKKTRNSLGFSNFSNLNDLLVSHSTYKDKFLDLNWILKFRNSQQQSLCPSH